MNGHRERMEQAERMIRKGEYHEAAVILGEILREDKTDGRTAFDLGNIALFTGEYETARRYYEEAEAAGYSTYAVYLNLAAACARMSDAEETGNRRKIERLYMQAARAAEEPDEQILTASAQTLFYLRNGMMLKAKREAQRLTDRFPEQYQGHHLLFLVLAEREQYEEIEKHLAEISERFSNELQYQLDSLAVLEMQEKDEEYLKASEKMPQILKAFPEMILSKKAAVCGKKKDYAAARQAIDELADTYGDPDAVFSEMLFCLADGDYVRAGAVANFIMEQEYKKANLRFFLTMYMQIFILYMGFDRKPDENVKKVMGKYADICLKWFEENGFDAADLKAEIKKVL